MTPTIQIPRKFHSLLERGKYRNKVFYGGRGGAKSHNFARALLVLGMEEKTRVACGREIQKSIKDSVYQLLVDIIREHELEPFYEILSDRIRGKNGTQFSFLGLKHNVTGIKSLEGTDIFWVEEAENVSDNSWETLIPTIRKEKSEIWVSFNPKNPTDPTYMRFVANAGDDTLCEKVSWADNPFFPEVLDHERMKLLSLDPEAYDHIWEGGFDTRRSGAVYAKQISTAREDNRITTVPYDMSSEVFTAWDLGFGDSTAIWWLQFVGRELRWLEYYENSGEQLDHYVQIIKGKPYNYMQNAHHLPHDGGHGNIRGDSVSAQLFDMGLGNVVLEREPDINPGIELLRQTIAFSVFDKEKCKDGIHALENYSYEWDDNKKTFSKRPRHDWASDGADSARYAAKAASILKGNLTKTVDPYKNSYHSSVGWMGA